MEIIKMKPCFKQYIWGGDNIRKIYGKDTPEPPVAESWEISAHADGLSTADGGAYSGMTIPELCTEYGSDFYGGSMKSGDDFPLMLKILDAEDKLSVQVHPDDEYAGIHESGSRGKTEAWYILSAREGAQLVYGFKRDVTPEEFKNAAEGGTLDDILNKVTCRAGDVFYIPSGTVHAVGAGMMIAEIQQSSNVTYRVFDYNRRSKDGKPRELHVDKAVSVSNTLSSSGREKTEGMVETDGKNKIRHVIDNEFFTFDEIDICTSLLSNTNNLLHMVFIADGGFTLAGVKLKKGDSALIPASVGEYELTGSGKVLLYYTDRGAR